MMNLKSKLLLLFFVLSIIWIACRKTDTRPQENVVPSTPIKESRFFTEHRSTNPQVQGIMQWLQAKNTNKNFVTKTVNQIGYPRWDKAFVQASNANLSHRGGTDTSFTLFFIPFVRDSQNYVNASMVVKATATDTVMNYICDWQYQDFGFSALSDTAIRAKNIFHLFTLFDNYTFGHKKFLLTDTRLYTHQDSLAIINNNLSFDSAAVLYRIDSVGVSGRLESYIQTTCTDYAVCVLSAPPTPSSSPAGFRTRLNARSSSSLPSSSNCLAFAIWTYCTEVEILEPGDIPTGGTSTPPTGTGGGGGASGGGSSTPPECSGPTTGNRIETNYNCGPGWVPIQEQPIPYVYNFLTKPCLISILDTLSSGSSSDFFKEIYNTFDTSTVTNLIIIEADLTNDSAYGHAVPPYPSPNGGVSFQIALDTVNLLNCSKEWMAYVMIHEVAHAAMFANVINWDTTNSQHQAMMTTFLTKMANSLTQSFNITLYDAFAICYSGFNNGIDQNSGAPDDALLLLALKDVKRQLNDPTVDAQQLISRGVEFTQWGAAGTRGQCN
jgi:hypothetical protein